MRIDKDHTINTVAAVLARRGDWEAIEEILDDLHLRERIDFGDRLDVACPERKAAADKARKRT